MAVHPHFSEFHRPIFCFFNRKSQALVPSHFPLTLPPVPDSSANMFTSNGVATNLRKRKMKEVGAEAAEPNPTMNLFNLQGTQFQSPNVPLNFASPSRVPFNGRGTQVQQILNNAAPLKPFSFTALLTAEDDINEDDRNTRPTDTNRQTQQIDQIIFHHTKHLRQALSGVLENHTHALDHTANERAAKKLKEKEFELLIKSAQNADLERKAEHHKREAERLLSRVRFLERTTMSLREGLQEANAARRYAETVEEDAESSFEDPHRVGPVRLDCKACERQIATVMMWPCRHVCVCTRGDDVVKVCPVCRLMKATSVEFYLPLN